MVAAIGGAVLVSFHFEFTRMTGRWTSLASRPDSATGWPCAHRVDALGSLPDTAIGRAAFHAAPRVDLLE
jgi:hypothetical protein